MNPSSAGWIVIGKSNNGWVEWKDLQGNFIENIEIKRKQLIHRLAVIKLMRGKLMPNLKAKEYRQFEDIKYIRKDGSEYWSARELAPVLDYSQWRNFQR